MRTLTDDERDLLLHISRWSASGYPVAKLGRGWSWSYRGIAGPPVVFKTKREAVESFEAFLEVLRKVVRAEAQVRAIRERLACGRSAEDIAQAMHEQGGGPLLACLARVREVAR